MKTKRRCVICDKEFNTVYGHKRTCSKECSVKLKKINHDRWIDENRDDFNAYKREYHATKDRDRIAAKQKAWRKTDAGRKFRTENSRKRRREDPLFRAKQALRKRLWEYKHKLGKHLSCTKSIGCTWEEFKAHIEKQFYDCPRTGTKMTWDNYGAQIDPMFPKWEIDHIVPLCVASNIEELEKLNHFSNLRPLWRKDNVLKSVQDSALNRSETNARGVNREANSDNDDFGPCLGS